MHAAAYSFVAHAVGSAKIDKVVEIGSRHINGSIRPIFSLASEYVGVDITPGAGVDVVMPGQDYVPLFKPDVVVCCEVLEHVDVATGFAIVSNAVKMLKKGGKFYATMAHIARPPHSAVDGGPLRPDEYYGNVTIETLKYWDEMIEDPHTFSIEVPPNSEDVYITVEKLK